MTIYILKTCSCGQYHHTLPNVGTKLAQGMVWFQCPQCDSTLVVPAKLIADQQLGNAWATRMKNGEYNKLPTKEERELYE